MAAVGSSGQSEALGEHKLRTIHAVGQALAIGPIFSAAIILGIASAPIYAGVNATASILAGTIGVLGLGYIVSLYARRYAGAGAVYEYLTRGVGPTVGIFAAGVFFLGTLFLGAGGIYIALGIFVDGFFAAHLDAIDPPWWLGGLLIAGVVFLFNHYGVRLAIGAILVITSLSALPFLLLAVVIIAEGGADGNTLAVLDPTTTSWSTAFNGILFAVTLFIGFEAAASLGEETRDPRRSIPIAVLSTIAISGVFYVLMSYAASIGFGLRAVEEGAWVGDPAPMSTLATEYVGSWLGVIIELVTIFDATALAIAICVTASRGFFALARDGLLPRALATTTARGTPLAGNLLVLASALAFILFAAVTRYGEPVELPNELQAFFITTTVGSFCVELVYLLLALGAIRIVWSMNGQPGQWWRYPALLAAIATPILGFKGALDPFPEFPTNRGFYFALGVVAVAALWLLVLRLTRPHAVRTAASYALAPHGGAGAAEAAGEPRRATT
jgi:amino acid transporter